MAQAWANQTGGKAKGVVDGTTEYTNINVIGWWKFWKYMDKLNKKRERDKYGFSMFGSINYPTNSKGVKWETFEGCEIE